MWEVGAALPAFLFCGKGSRPGSNGELPRCGGNDREVDMGNELLQILDYIEQERGISRDSLIRALENAILIG